MNHQPNNYLLKPFVMPLIHFLKYLLMQLSKAHYLLLIYIIIPGTICSTTSLTYLLKSNNNCIEPSYIPAYDLQQDKDAYKSPTQDAPHSKTASSLPSTTQTLFGATSLTTYPTPTTITLALKPVIRACQRLTHNLQTSTTTKMLYVPHHNFPHPIHQNHSSKKVFSPLTNSQFIRNLATIH